MQSPKMDDVISQIISGDMTHRDFFIQRYIYLARAIAGKISCYRGPDTVSEAYLALCKIPDELAQGRYKNEPNEKGIGKYVTVRIVTACHRWQRRNHLIRIPYTVLAENPDMEPLKQITHILPGERFNNEKTQHVPIPIFDLLSSPEDPPDLELTYKGLTGVEARMIVDIKQGMSVNNLAKKYSVSRRTIRSRMDNIKSKIRK